MHKKGANLCRQNCDPLDENNVFTAGVESQTFSAKGPFLTGWLHMYLFMIGLRGVGIHCSRKQGFTPHDPIVGEMAILRFLLSRERKIHAEPCSGFWDCTKLISS